MMSHRGQINLLDEIIVDNFAGGGGCYWVEPDLCSRCMEMEADT